MLDVWNKGVSIGVLDIDDVFDDDFLVLIELMLGFV